MAQVINDWFELQNPENPIGELEPEIADLRRHGEAGHLSYVRYRQLGLPCGSGAIESSIRQVINLRLKSNAKFWQSAHAESMLQVRSQVVPDQWDPAMSELSEFRRTEADDSWQWEPQNMSIKNEDSPPVRRSQVTRLPSVTCCVPLPALPALPALPCLFPVLFYLLCFPCAVLFPVRSAETNTAYAIYTNDAMVTMI